MLGLPHTTRRGHSLPQPRHKGPRNLLWTVATGMVNRRNRPIAAAEAGCDRLVRQGPGQMRECRNVSQPALSRYRGRLRQNGATGAETDARVSQRVATSPQPLQTPVATGWCNRGRDGCESVATCRKRPSAATEAGCDRMVQQGPGQMRECRNMSQTAPSRHRGRLRQNGATGAGTDARVSQHVANGPQPPQRPVATVIDRMVSTG